MVLQSYSTGLGTVICYHCNYLMDISYLCECENKDNQVPLLYCPVKTWPFVNKPQPYCI